MIAPSTTTKRTLSTAEERREDVLEAALDAFAERGFLGTPTAEIAKAAGISQAYLFRLFPTKLDLVTAVAQRANDVLYAVMAGAVARAKAAGDDPKMAMAEAYAELLQDRRQLMVQVHQHAAATSMPELAAVSRACFERLVALVETETDLDPESVQRFFAHGMLMNVMAAIGAEDAHGHWAQVLRVC